MVVMVTNASRKMIGRLMESDMGDKIAWIAETSDGNIMCMDESIYTLESGRLYTGREFVNIRSEGKVFPIYNGEYDMIIME